MAYVITEACVGVKDKSCQDVCPVECIHGKEEDKQLFIDPQECIDCAACEPECPVQAIFLQEDLPDNLAHYAKVNADYFKD